MLPVILVHLVGHVGILNVFRYITFRAGGAVMTALFIAFVFGPAMIRWLRERQGKGQPIRTDGPQRHVVEKQGTPTMGGLLILISSVGATLLWADLSQIYVWVVLFVTLSFGLLGFVDDSLKVVDRRRFGVSLVQRAAGHGLHGRHGIALARRGARRRRRHHQTRDRARHRGWVVRHRSGIGDRAGRFVQDDWQAHISHGADPSSF